MARLSTSPTVIDNHTPSISKMRGSTSTGDDHKNDRSAERQNGRGFSVIERREPAGSKYVERHHRKTGGNDMEAVQGNTRNMDIAFGKEDHNEAAKQIADRRHHSRGPQQRQNADTEQLG